MTGSILSNYLSAHGSDGFYNLYHELSECIMSRLGSFGILEVIARSWNENTSTCEALDAYVKQSKNAQQVVREFFWPVTQFQEPELRRKHQMNRWEPFDEYAWADMVSQLGVCLQSFIPILQACHEKALSAVAELQLGEISAKQVLNDVGKHLEELPRWCFPEWIEYQLFVHPSLRRVKANCQMISWNLNRLREFCDQNVKPDTNLDALAHMAEAFYLAIAHFFWPGTFDESGEEPSPATNHWFPYDESKWNNALSRISVVCIAFVRDGRQQLKALRSDPAMTLPGAEKIQPVFLSVGFDLDHISRLIESFPIS